MYLIYIHILQTLTVKYLIYVLKHTLLSPLFILGTFIFNLI